MNIHWGRTMRYGWLPHKRKPNHNLTSTSYWQFVPPYNLSDSEGAHYSSLVVNGRPYVSDIVLRNKSVANISALHADNDFLKKSGLIRDMIGNTTRSHSFTTVVIIASIFLFVTMGLTTALVIFCRKRNSVFAFQKSEQEDYPDYEMEELNTDVEYTETDNESDTESYSTGRRRSSQHSHRSQRSHTGHRSSPDRRPLVESTYRCENEVPDGGNLCYHDHSCHCHQAHLTRGDYQMVVTALLERQPNECDTDESSSLMSDRTSTPKGKKYYGVTNMPPCLLQDNTVPKFPCRMPKLNITYTDKAPSLDKDGQLNHDEQHAMYQVVVTLDNATKALDSKNSHSNVQYQRPAETKVKTVDSDTKGATNDVLYVDLPPLEKSKCDDAQLRVCSEDDCCSPDIDHGYLYNTQSFTPPKRSLSLKEDICAITMATTPTEVTVPTEQCRSISQPPTPMSEGMQFHPVMQVMEFSSSSSMAGQVRSGRSSRASLPSATNFTVTGAETLCSRQHLDRSCSIKSLTRQQYLSLMSLHNHRFPTPVADLHAATAQCRHVNANNNCNNAAVQCHQHFHVEPTSPQCQATSHQS